MQRVFLLLLIFWSSRMAAQFEKPKPGTIDYYINKAVEFESNCEFEKAIVFTDSALMVDPNYDNVYIIRAENLWMMNRFSEAADNYQKALLVDKDGSYLNGAYLMLGVLYEKAGKPAKAQDEYLRTIYLHENKKTEKDKFFEDINKTDYALALKFSGNDSGWNRLMNEPFYQRMAITYTGKTREQMIDIYFTPYKASCPEKEFNDGKKIDRLKTGFWKQKTDNWDLAMGNYVIIPFKTYETIRDLGTGTYEVKYKGSTPLLFYDGMQNGNISVKDSIWNYYDENGKLRRTVSWIKGIDEWSKNYNEKGELTEYNFDDFDNDTGFHYTYINQRLFRKGYYPPENKNRQTEVYYPDDKLNLSHAELSFTVNFLEKPISKETIQLLAKSDIVIQSIKTQREFVSISQADGKPIKLPLRLNANSVTPIVITATPTSANYRQTDTIQIVTSESKAPYFIYSNISAYHIDGRSVDTLKSIELSKSKDQFLILPSMGTVTDATIVSKDGKKVFYEIIRTRKIDLSNFAAGTYLLQISSCNSGGDIKFVIRE